MPSAPTATLIELLSSAAPVSGPERCRPASKREDPVALIDIEVAVGGIDGEALRVGDIGGCELFGRVAVADDAAVALDHRFEESNE